MASTSTPTPKAPPPPVTIPPITWEGDRMFNIYVLDYCNKHGYRKTAEQLCREADIPSDASPPINARQGLLFEWWSVFWILFQAKTGNVTTDDAQTYTIHQQNLRNARNSGHPPGSGAGPAPRLPNGMPATNLPNGIPSRQPPNFAPGGPMPNGAPMSGQPPPGQPMQAGSSMSFGGMGGSHGPSHVNAVASGSGQSGPQQPPQQQPQHTLPGTPGGPPMPFGMMSAQRPHMVNGILPSQQGQQRGPLSNGPFHSSPSMAPSPQHNVGGSGPGPHQQQQGHPSQPGQPGAPAPMAQLGPSPHMGPSPMNRGMPPPNNGGPGMQITPMNTGMQPQSNGGPPTPGFAQQQGAPGGPGGRPPSRTQTPRGPGGMMAIPSPSLAPRQTPGGGPPGLNPGSGQMQPPHAMMPGGMMSGQPPMGLPMGMTIPGNNDAVVNQEILTIPHNQLNLLKGELGYGEKELASLNMSEKNKILGLWRTRIQPKPQPGMMQPPSQISQPPNQMPQQRPGGGPPPPQPGAQQRLKRSSTSPGEEHEILPRNDTSPPERKRMRRSPADQPTPYPPQPPGQQQSQPPGQQPPGQQQHPGQMPPPQPLQPGQQQQQPGQQQQSGPQGGPQVGPPPGGGPPQGGPPSGPLGMNNNMLMRPPSGINGPPMNMGPGNGPPPLPGTPGGPQPQHMINGMMGMGMPPGPPRMFTPQQSPQSQQQQPPQQDPSRNSMYPFHVPPPQHPQPPQKGPGNPENPFHTGGPGPNQGGAPTPGSQQFAASPLNMNRKTPSMPSMLPPPPPSPAMSAQNKDAKTPGGPAQQPNGQPQPPQGGPIPPSHSVNGSPRNPSVSGGGTAPATPVPSNQATPQQQAQQQQGPPPPPSAPSSAPQPPSQVQQPQQPNHMNNIMSGASLMDMGPPGGMDNSEIMFDAALFGMTNMGNMDGEYDANNIFTSNDINFERDFGQWFQPDQDSGGGMGPGLDLAG